MVQGFGPPPARVAVAVSGGGDSLALLHLMADWQAAGGPELVAVTLDHGLRSEAAAEAALVAAQASARGVRHDVLHWTDRPPGNLMAQARAARTRLIGAWAQAQGAGAVALGHTADDLAETFLMRLARGSGVDGLSAMAPRRRAGGALWVRPLLTARREDLRAFLRDRGLSWAEDPTNADPAYLRSRARAALRALAPLGITVATLAETAGRMARARAALEAATAELADRAARLEQGAVLIDRAALAAAPEEVALRLFAHALDWVAPGDYRPRFAALRRAFAAALAGRAATLAGARLRARGPDIRISREARTADPSPRPDAAFRAGIFAH